MSEGSRSIVSVGWLAAHQNDPDIVVADVRWYLPTTGRNGREEYETDHVPGAVFVDLERDLAVPGGPGHGRHPLPPVDAFAAALGALGIGNRSHVIAYDDAAGSTAARLWWMLRQVGHRRVSVLDGGLSAWRATGYPVTADVPEIAPTTFIPDMRHGLVASRSDVDDARSSPGSVVIDARARERFEGRVEPIDVRAGHIPGARNAPFSENLVRSETDGISRFKTAEALRRQFQNVGIDETKAVIVYCGSGVTACHNALALDIAGLPEPRLYVGSWSDWSSDEALPVATGEA